MRLILAIATVFLSHSAFANLYASPSMVSFYNVRVGSWRYINIRLNNWSNEALYVNVDGFNCYNQFRISDFGCRKLHPRDSCEIQVEFSPRRQGRYRCDIEIDASNGEYISIPVSGDAVEDL